MLVDQDDADVRTRQETLEGRLDLFLSCFWLVMPTVVHDQEIGLSLVVSLTDAGQEETGDSVFVSDDRNEGG